MYSQVTHFQLLSPSVEQTSPYRFFLPSFFDLHIHFVREGEKVLCTGRELLIIVRVNVYGVPMVGEGAWYFYYRPT